METPDFYHHLCSSNPTQDQQFTPEKSKSSVADHFIIEDLLDFSHEDDPIPTDPTTTNFDSTDSSNLSSFSGVSDPLPTFPNSHLSTELCVPYDDIAELEWLSNFVEDSFSSDDLQKLQLISGRQPKPDPLTETARSNPIFRPDMMQVPGKARSKRNRQAPCNWSSRLLVLSPTTSSSESDNPSNLSGSNLSNHSVGKKAPKKKELAENSDGRKCLHCQTDKTPQWRTGPMGPKTLCNACGVRYKSGRLVPEYRPAASPTFVLAKHSNSHRKVLELRRQKEMQMSQHQQFLYPNALFDVSGAGAGAGGPGGCDEYLIHHQTGPDYRQLI